MFSPRSRGRKLVLMRDATQARTPFTPRLSPFTVGEVSLMIYFFLSKRKILTAYANT